MPSHSQPWPVAPRPFDDEAFGSWLGRLASRYRIGVDDLVRAAGIELDIDLDVCRWLDTPAPAQRAAVQLGQLCRLSPVTLRQMLPAARSERPTLAYCYQCLIMNRLDVTAPYWKAAWLDADGPPCTVHLERASRVTTTAMRTNRNMGNLLGYLYRQRRQSDYQPKIGYWYPH